MNSVNKILIPYTPVINFNGIVIKIVALSVDKNICL